MSSQHTFYVIVKCYNRMMLGWQTLTNRQISSFNLIIIWFYYIHFSLFMSISQWLDHFNATKFFPSSINSFVNFTWILYYFSHIYHLIICNVNVCHWCFWIYLEVNEWGRACYGNMRHGENNYISIMNETTQSLHLKHLDKITNRIRYGYHRQVLLGCDHSLCVSLLLWHHDV